MAGDCDFGRDPTPDLHDILRALRAEHRVAPVRFHGQDAHMILRHDDLEAALRDDETFAALDAYKIFGEPAQGRTMLCMADDEHRINRRLLSAPFTRKAVRASIDALLAPIAHELLDALEGRGQVDLVRDFIHEYPNMIITRMLGLPAAANADFKFWADGLLNYLVDRESGLRAREEFTRYLQPVVDQRRANPGDDLLSVMVQAEIEGERLTDEEIFSFVRLLFPAGAGTTYLTMGSLFYNVLSQPAVRAAADKSSQRKAIVEESLRLEPPVAVLPRICSQDTVLRGVPMTTGDWVLFAIASANRDEEVYPDPDRFDAGREIKRPSVFGAGVHICLGQHLARAEMEVALGAFIERFPDARLADPTNVYFRGAVFRGPKSLPCFL